MPSHLSIDKPDTLIGDEVHITAHGLLPNTAYKMVMRLPHNYGSHMAFAVFQSDATGMIHVPSASPLRGTYHDADPMGLFLSQRPCQDFQFGGYLRCTPPLPFTYKLMLFDSGDVLLDTVFIKKHWMHPRLTRTEIDQDGFCATLFRPPGDGPFPCILDISGTGGGLHEHKGSALASEGFVVLCVAFFQYKGLVKKLEEVEVEYFAKPIDWLIAQPFTNDVIGIQGVSFGATIVDILATRYPQIKSVVSINGPIAQNRYLTLRENGAFLPQAPTDDTNIYFINGIMCSDKVMASMRMTDETRIPFERVAKDVAFRFVGSVDDLVSNSVFASYDKAKALRESGHEHVEIDLVNGGHIMEPPYFPHHDIVYAKFQGFYCGYGGEVVLHGKSQEASWRRTVAFFKKTLGAPPPMPDWSRLDVVEERRAAKL